MVEDKLYSLLSQRDAGPLSFIMFYPSVHYDRNKEHQLYSPHKGLVSWILQVKQSEHAYIAGKSHTMQEKSAVDATHDSHVVLLQNAKGQEKYQPRYAGMSREDSLKKFQELLKERFKCSSMKKGLLR